VAALLLLLVIPAKAGIQFLALRVKDQCKELDSGFRRNDELSARSWIPALAGMTTYGSRARSGLAALLLKAATMTS